MTLREKVKEINDRLNKFICCFNNKYSSLASAYVMQVDVAEGSHSYSHGLSKEPVAVITYESDNQPIDFADITFDATNIALTSDGDIAGVKFIMFVIP